MLKEAFDRGMQGSFERFKLSTLGPGGTRRIVSAAPGAAIPGSAPNLSGPHPGPSESMGNHPAYAQSQAPVVEMKSPRSLGGPAPQGGSSVVATGDPSGMGFGAAAGPHAPAPAPAGPAPGPVGGFLSKQLSHAQGLGSGVSNLAHNLGGGVEGALARQGIYSQLGHNLKGLAPSLATAGALGLGAHFLGGNDDDRRRQ